MNYMKSGVMLLMVEPVTVVERVLVQAKCPVQADTRRRTGSWSR